MNFKSRTSLHIMLLLAACFFLFFFRMGARDLWTPDEPRYAQVAREMLETGEWLVPHLNGIVYTEKPPLYFWLIALASKPFGDLSFVCRATTEQDYRLQASASAEGGGTQGAWYRKFGADRKIRRVIINEGHYVISTKNGIDSRLCKNDMDSWKALKRCLRQG